MLFRSLERYRDETRRLLGVLETRLENREYIMGGEYTIADVATWPWVRTLGGFYEADEVIGLDDFERVDDWLERCSLRPASRLAINIPERT